MSDLKDQLLRFIDGLEEAVSVQETMSRRNQRRFQVPAAVLAGAAIVLIPALVLIGLRWLPGVGEEAAETTVAATATATTTTPTPPTTATTSESLTTGVPTILVPDVIGLPVEEAQEMVEAAGLEWTVVNEYTDEMSAGYIVSQDPAPGTAVALGTLITIETPVFPACLDWGEADRVDPPEGQVEIGLLFECANRDSFPGRWETVYRTVDESATAIEASLRELLAGPTETERNAGFDSFFSAGSADALNSVALEGDRLLVDFNDSILINNIGTSTGGMFFMADLQANLFQFPEVTSIEFQRNGSCDGFWGMMESTCTIVTRSDWEQRVATWDAERALHAEPGEVLGIDDIVGTTFNTQLHNDSQEIMASRDGNFDGDLFYSGFSEIGGWLLDNATTDDLKNWALHVTGQNAEMIWLVESVGHTDEGSMIYTVRAVLEIPWWQIEEVMQGDPFVRDGATACTRNGVFNPRLVVVAEVSETAGVISDYMNPLLAWLINVDGARFVEIPVDGVECLFDLS